MRHRIKWYWIKSTSDIMYPVLHTRQIHYNEALLYYSNAFIPTCRISILYGDKLAGNVMTIVTALINALHPLSPKGQHPFLWERNSQLTTEHVTVLSQAFFAYETCSSLECCYCHSLCIRTQITLCRWRYNCEHVIRITWLLFAPLASTHFGQFFTPFPLGLGDNCQTFSDPL